MKKTASTHKKWLEKHGHWAHFTHRDSMRRKKPLPKASLPKTVPATSLPVDCTGKQTCSCPMDGNDTLGICGPAMCDHVDGIRSYGQGKPGFAEVHANLTALESQYETVSGGDNGTDEDMLVGASGIWMTGIAGDATCVVADHLDVDINDVALTQFCLDQFYAICMAWSVPDDFLNSFAQGTVWDSPGVPDPNNGHYTPLSDVDASGRYSLWTWGTFCWVAPAFVASVDPQSFVTFSALQFNASGYDSHGRHVSEQATKWVGIGGDAAKVAAIVAKFPPIPAPSPPAPTPTPSAAPTLAQAQAAADAAIHACHPLMTRSQAQAAVDAALKPLWP